MWKEKALEGRNPGGEEGNDKRDLPKDGNSLKDVKDPKKLDQSTSINDLTIVSKSINPMVEKGKTSSLEKGGKDSASDPNEKETNISVVMDSSVGPIRVTKDHPLSQESNTNPNNGISPATVNRILERFLATSLGHLS